MDPGRFELPTPTCKIGVFPIKLRTQGVEMSQTKLLRTCLSCGKDFQATKSEINRGNARYCSRSCSYKRTTGRTTTCPCGTETRNPKYCSRSCAATYNNRTYPKGGPPPKLRYCKRCGILLDRSEYSKTNRCCHDCRRPFGELTLTEVRLDNAHSRHTRITANAKNTYSKSDRPKHCVKCGYDKHYEVCHIKAIKDFPDTAKMKEVNHLDNLIALCPNCHWEFDHTVNLS